MKDLFHINKFAILLLFFSFVFILFFSIPSSAQDFYEIANWEKLYSHNLYTATIFQINKVTDIPDDLKNYVLGTCYYYIGKYELAETFFKKVSSTLFRYKHDPVSFYLGIIAFLKNDFLVSATYFNEIAGIYNELEESGKFLYYFSLALIEIGKTDLALKYLNIGIESEYQFYKQYYSFTIAKIYYNLHDFNKASVEFEKFLFLYSDSTLADDTLYYLGKSYYYLKDYKSAKRSFSSIINLYRNSEYYYSSLYYLGQITGNKIYFEEIILKNPGFNLIDYVLYYLAKIYYSDNMYEKAFDYFLEAFNRTENQSLKYNCIIFMIKIKGDISSSFLQKLNEEQRKPILEYILSNYFYFNQLDKIFKYEKSIFYNEILSNYKTLIVLAKAYLKIDDYKKSLNLFLDALKLNPADYKLYFFIGYCYYKLSDFENAFKMFNKVIIESNIELYYGYYSYLYLGIIELKQNNFKNSQQYFEQIILKYPTYKTIGETYYFLSIVFYNLKDYHKSLSAIEFSYSSNISGMMRLAVIYQYAIVSMRFDFVKTEELFNEYKNLSEDKKQIFLLAIKIAEYSFSLGKYDSAKFYYEKALLYTEDNKEKIDLLIQLATIDYNTKDYTTAYLKMLELINDKIEYRYKDILFLFFNCAIQLKKFDAAKYILNINPEIFNDFNNFFIQFINIYKEQSLYGDAIKFIDTIIEKYSNIDNSIKYNLLLNKALIYFEQNNYEFALKEFQDLYQQFPEKQRDLELYIIDCSLRYKDFELLISKIPVLLKYNDENLYNNAFYLILKLYFMGKIEQNFIKELIDSDLLKAEDFKVSILLLYIENKGKLKDFTQNIKEYLSSKNSENAYWSRFFYSIALLDAKNFKNSRLILESLINVSDYFQKEFLYYFLYLIEKTEGKEKKYWESLSKDYPFSIFL